MSIAFTIHPDNRLIVTTASGEVTYSDIKANQAEMLADPLFDPSFDQLIDMTGLRDLHLSSGEVIQAAEKLIFGKRSKRALVAGLPVIYGVGWMMEIYHSRLGHAQVFYKMEDALQWLGLERKPE